MRIVVLIDYFQPKLGYQEFFLAKAFKKLGHDVSVVTSNYYFPFPDYKDSIFKTLGNRKRKTGLFLEEGLKVYRLPMIFESSNGAVTLISQLEKYFIKIKPDIVYADGILTPLAYQIALIKEKLKFKLFYDNHASSFNTKLDDSLLKKGYLIFFKTFLMPKIKKSADGFTAIGNSEKKLLCQIYNLESSEVNLIPLGADATVFSPDNSKRKETRKKLNIRNNELLIIYAGKITKNKDLEILLYAFSLCYLKIKNLKIIILGSGNKGYIKYLKEEANRRNIQKKTIFHDIIENKELANFYNAADLGIWPGNLSNTIIEAMACGLPIILPRYISEDQSSSHLLNYHNGLSFERGNPSDLSKKIIYFSENLDKSREMGKRSRKLVEEEYSWEKIATKYLSLYEKN